MQARIAPARPGFARPLATAAVMGVDNRAGAAGSVAAEILARSAPDGHAIMEFE
jgi:tripartite-type tricarboxylate transporter receptor subunit TctC